VGESTSLFVEIRIEAERNVDGRRKCKGRLKRYEVRID
jgi:hypothetical protein